MEDPGPLRRQAAISRSCGVAAAVLLVAALGSSAAEARRSPPPIKNPALLNIGFVCKWQDRCIGKQQRAMSRSLRYLKTHALHPWKIRLCNRNSSRGGTRKDWIGFDNCIRNARLRSPGRAIWRR